VRQTPHRTDQIAAWLHLIYTLFTRKTEGQRWRRMWRLAAGRELSRISASDDRIEGTAASSAGRPTPTRYDRDVICARTREALRATFDGLVQWMVQDASPGR
jgi:hypothetical protein